MKALDAVDQVVNRKQTTKLIKELYEAPTEDGMSLIVVRKRPVGPRHGAPVLFIHGLGQNRYSWDLSQRSLANYLVDAGFETHNAELRGHGLSRANGSDYPENFEAYVRYDLPALIRAVKKVSGAKKVFVCGHSLGGTIAYCVGPKHTESLAGIVSIGGPYNFGRGNRLFQWGAKLARFAYYYTLLPYMLPRLLYVDLIGTLVEEGLFYLDHPYNLFPFRLWYPRSIERDILEERIEKGFDRTSFAVFRLMMRWAATGEDAVLEGADAFSGRIEELRVPIVFVAGNEDDVAPLESMEQAFEKAGSGDKTLKVFGPEDHAVDWGHCDLICGKYAPREVWPYILRWLESRLPA
jgi:pimeloyl-ACP methyl ester carboxylesterase